MPMNRAGTMWFWMLDYAYTVADETQLALQRLTRARHPHWLVSSSQTHRDARPVVLIAGVFETWQTMRKVGAEAHRLGHPVHVLPELGRNRQSIDRSAREVASYLREHNLHGVILLTHSKGGLVGKYMMLRLDEDVRVDGMVAINTPFF